MNAQIYDQICDRYASLRRSYRTGLAAGTIRRNSFADWGWQRVLGRMARHITAGPQNLPARTVRYYQRATTGVR